MANPHHVRPGSGEGAHHRLADSCPAVRHQHLAKFWIAGHLTQLAIVSHVRHLIDGEGQENALIGLVQPRADAHPAGGRGAAPVQMHHGRRPGIEPNQTQPPGDALPKEEIVAMVHPRFRHQFTCARLFAPDQRTGQAPVAGFARWILHRTARTADLQFEPAERGRRGQSQRGARPRPRRQQRLRRASDRILPFGLGERGYQASARLSMAAPEHNPRS